MKYQQDSLMLTEDIFINNAPIISKRQYNFPKLT